MILRIVPAQAHLKRTTDPDPADDPMRRPFSPTAPRPFETPPACRRPIRLTSPSKAATTLASTSAPTSKSIKTTTHTSTSQDVIHQRGHTALPASHQTSQGLLPLAFTSHQTSMAAPDRELHLPDMAEAPDAPFRLRRYSRLVRTAALPLLPTTPPFRSLSTITTTYLDPRPTSVRASR